MRILYMLNPRAIGGAERLVLALGERMAARGHSVRIVALGEERPDEWATNLNLIRLGMDRHPVHALSGVVQGARALRDFRPHIVHSHNFHGNMMARALLLTRRSTRVISTLHNEYEGGTARMFALKAHRFSQQEKRGGESGGCRARAATGNCSAGKMPCHPERNRHRFSYS